MKTDLSLKTKTDLQEGIASFRKETVRLQKKCPHGEKYRAILEQSSDSLVLVDSNTGGVLEFNEMAYKGLGYTLEEFKGFRIKDFEAIESPVEVKKHMNWVMKNGPTVFETKHRRKDGQIRNIIVRSKPVKIDNKKYLLLAWSDITEQKFSEKKISESKNELEDLVVALRVLLKHGDENGAETAENIIERLNKLVTPYIEKLNNICNDSKQKKYLKIIEKNLEEICENYSKSLTSKYSNLTSSEMQVVNLINQNKTSKEISELMNVSVSTIDFHRKNIRTKMNLTNTKTSLKSHISSLQK